MKQFSFCTATEHDVDAIRTLVATVFDQFVAPNYNAEGNQEFYTYLENDAIKERLHENHIIFLCKEKDVIVGIIEIRNFNHISMLFVQSEYQGKGIAKKLLSMAIAECKKRKSALTEISVHASPNAVGIYEKLGFKKTKEEQISNGIRFTPMVLRI